MTTNTEKLQDGTDVVINQYASPQQVQELVLKQIDHQKERCLHCKFFDCTDAVSVNVYQRVHGTYVNACLDGFCRRYPPSIPNDEIIQGAQQPLVEFDDWCGEFARRAVPLSLTELCHGHVSRGVSNE